MPPKKGTKKAATTKGKIKVLNFPTLITLGIAVAAKKAAVTK